MTRDELDQEVMEFGLAFSDILEAIRSGIADGREDELYEAIGQRQELRSAHVIAQLRRGQRVIAVPHVRPKHLAGARGEVVELKPRSGKAVVRWDHDHRLWTMHGASLVPVPTSAAA